MADLELIKRLNIKYNKDSPIKKAKTFAINEAYDPNRLEKAMNDSISAMGIHYAQYFELGLPAQVALLFIDVCGFSTRFNHLDGEKISTYFDNYYDIIIPIIYRYGGEIDKIIGDGIVCVFGPPFLEQDLTKNIRRANLSAREIIEATNATKFSSKIAFHCGVINYFKNKTGLYRELTMIGKPVTELFRLESVSVDERINYFGDTEIRKFFEQTNLKSLDQIKWEHYNHILPTLKGISFTKHYSIKRSV